ncbi:hypothetical protein J8I29_21905 [Labrys sp. LIt4]|uniref:Uncharacterized protein n=1 Tax=Labrys okinawensis TaxID=346911 RepID=A0A2S9QD60_9HYPH|nr:MULTISPECIES: hypothetical protein [Labrys]MBP0581999.1 hypothetical protein [Labrys sp. LIt4]PRH87287.1 hypothetical protein C5L14_11700 [Labrys okinawensis]
MTARIARLLAPETALFACASMAHAGLLPFGEPHSRAATAEAIIAVILALGLATSLVRPPLARFAALAAQGLALLGTLVGAVTIAIGIGPQTVGDKIFHIVLVAVLVFGLWRAAGIRQR